MNKEVKDLLKQIKTWLIIITVILLINTFILIIINENTTDTSNNNTATTEEENTEYDVSAFTEISATELYEQVKSTEYSVIYVGRSTCGYCVQFLPIMKQAQSDYNFTTYYLDIAKIIDFTNNTIIDQDAYDNITAYDDYISSKFGATPMVLIFKDGKFINGTVGYTDLETYESFLEENL